MLNSLQHGLRPKLLLLALVLLAQSAALQDAQPSKKQQSHKESLNACLKSAGVHTVTGGVVRVCTGALAGADGKVPLLLLSDPHCSDPH
jgi:hypothetical protein